MLGSSWAKHFKIMSFKFYIICNKNNITEDIVLILYKYIFQTFRQDFMSSLVVNNEVPYILGNDIS